MTGNVEILKIIERIRGIKRLESIANGVGEVTQAIEDLQKKNENGQQGNLSRRCSICDDTTWIEVLRGERTCVYRCKCYYEKNKDENSGFKKAGFSIGSSKLNFTNFKAYNGQMLEVKDMAIKYYKYFDKFKENRNNSILLCGNSGSGKTHLSMAIANNLIKKKINVLYMPYRDVITVIKQNMLNGDIYSKQVNKYKKAEVLLIDDLFKGQISKSDLNIVFEIINYRYMNNLPMIISTELTIEDLIEIDEAIGSRIYEMSSNYIVEILGRQNNYRLK